MRTGEYKDFIKSELVRNGAQIAQTFDKAVTHLIVAAPTSPHSQTPSSDKLVQARKNRHHLHPCLAVVWEGWIEAAIARGGLHANDTKLWTWREGEGPPVPPTVSAMPAAGRRGSPAPGRDQRPSVLCAPSIPSLDVEASEPDALPSVAPQDDAQILKKRRIAQASSLDNREGELAWALQLPTAQAAGASGNATIERRPVLSDADGLREVREPKADRAAGVKKTAIRALGERRSEVWTAARSDAKSLRADAAVADTNERLESGSFGAATRVRSGSHEPEATSTAAVPTIFADQSFALMELKGPDPSRLAEVVRAHGGTPHLDPASDQLAAADWVVVDYVECVSPLVAKRLLPAVPAFLLTGRNADRASNSSRATIRGSSACAGSSSASMRERSYRRPIASSRGPCRTTAPSRAPKRSMSTSRGFPMTARSFIISAASCRRSARRIVGSSRERRRTSCSLRWTQCRTLPKIDSAPPTRRRWLRR